MNRPAPTLGTARSWRDIPQEVAPRSMSREGRRRVNMSSIKWGVGALVVAVAAWGLVEILQTWQQNPTKLAAPVKSEPLRTIKLTTDGVLDLAWIERRLELPKGVTLMELDLLRLQSDLLADGQIRTAVLTRKFPDTLVASVQERSPVGRLRVADAYGVAGDYLVARDGVIFSGANFAPTLTSALPWLDGVKLHRAGSGFIPVAGMETVADLFATAQANVPQLYRNWRILSLERLAEDGEIVVKTADGMQIVFGMRDDFFKQVALLDSVLAEMRSQPQRAIATIDLTFGKRQVPVSFVPMEVSPPAAAPGTGSLNRQKPQRPGVAKDAPRAAPASRPSFFTFQPSQTRKTTRDL